MPTKEEMMKRWIKITLTIVVLVGLTLALYFVGFNGDWIKPILEKTGYWGYLIFIILQVIITTLMCFVPATTFTFSIIAAQMFGALPGFITAAIACFLSSMVMFTIGDKLGEPFVDWLIGKESRIKAQDMVSTRATVLVPFMLAFPFFPDDAICMVSGMTKMKYWYFAIVAAVTRTIGVGVTCFLGGNVIDYSAFSILDWVLVINLFAIDVFLVWKLSTWLENYIKERAIKKQKIKEEQETKDQDKEEDSDETSVSPLQ